MAKETTEVKELKRLLQDEKYRTARLEIDLEWERKRAQEQQNISRHLREKLEIHEGYFRLLDLTKRRY